MMFGTSVGSVALSCEISCAESGGALFPRLQR